MKFKDIDKGDYPEVEDFPILVYRRKKIWPITVLADKIENGKKYWVYFDGRTSSISMADFPLWVSMIPLYEHLQGFPLEENKRFSGTKSDES